MYIYLGQRHMADHNLVMQKTQVISSHGIDCEIRNCVYINKERI